MRKREAGGEERSQYIPISALQFTMSSRRQHHTMQCDLWLGHVHTASSQGGSSNSAAVAVHTACKRSLYVTYGQQHVHLLQMVQGLQHELKRALTQMPHDQGKEASTYLSDLPSRQCSRLPATHPSSSTCPVTNDPCVHPRVHIQC